VQDRHPIARFDIEDGSDRMRRLWGGGEVSFWRILVIGLVIVAVLPWLANRLWNS
jgi:hypothetical protein